MLLLLCSCFGGEREVATVNGFHSGTPGSAVWSASKLPLDLRTAPSIDALFVAGDFVAGKDPVEQMSQVWNDAIIGRTFLTVPANSTADPGYASVSSYANDSVMGVYIVNNWFADISSGVLAVTQFTGVRRNAGTASEFLELFHADIIFNGEDHSFTTDSADNSKYDFHSVALHELGHFIGLKHRSSASVSSVMAPFLTTSDVKRSLFTYDVNTLKRSYTSSSGASAILGAQGGGGTTTLAHEDPKNIVTGIIELNAKGECRHFLNKKLVGQHKVKL